MYSDGDKNVDFLRHLLLLLDRLELQISNATDGCATGSLPAVPRSSLVFFRTNKKTCHDYFLRIRPSIIAGAKIVRNDHLLITHATQVLHFLISGTNIIRHLILNLCNSLLDIERIRIKYTIDRYYQLVQGTEWIFV